jgi:hypothetical protein
MLTKVLENKFDSSGKDLDSSEVSPMVDFERDPAQVSIDFMKLHFGQKMFA